MEETIQFLLDKSLGAIGLTVLGFFANKWISSLEDNFQKTTTSFENKLENLEDRITAAEEKNRDILDIVISKFSNWEDRIALMLVKIKELTPEELKLEIEKFRAETKNDILNMKLEMRKVAENIGSKMTSPEITEQEKNDLATKLKSFEAALIHRIQDNEKRISLAIKMIAHVNNKSKEHEFKINNLVSTRKN